jgi:DNA recombination protein RmuC
VMQQILKDARMREAADQIRDEVMNLADDLGRLRERVGKLQTHFNQANEDVRMIVVSAEKIDRRAERIKDLEFGDEAAVEAPRGKPELFAVPTRKLQAGE